MAVDSTDLKKTIKALLSNSDCIEEFGANNCRLISSAIDNEAALPYIIELASEIDTFLINVFSSFAKENKKHSIRKKFEALKVFLFKQRKILIAVPQRKKNPNSPAPNLGGLATPQNYRLKGEVCYGLNYCDARTYLVKKALEDPEITDILFVDDDIILPLNAISLLCDTHEPIVGANYVKKQYPIETAALQVREINGVTHNQEIKADLGTLTPVNVSQMGLGACLISVEVFKKIQEPWFEFKYNENGSVFAGEDVRFCQKAILEGYAPKIIPSLVCAHLEFKTGKYWGPDWLVEHGKIRNEMVDRYCYFQGNPRECYEQDIK